MAKPDTFGAVNDAAADSFFELLANPDTIPAKSAEIEAGKAAPASSDTGTTPANDDGDKPATQDADGSGNEVVESAASTPTETEKPSEFDPDKTLAKYKTPEEREKALVESQRTILERERELAQVKAERDALKAGKPATETPKADVKPAETAQDPPKVAVPGYDEWLGRVHQAKPEELNPEEVKVKRAIASLGAEKTELKQLATKTSELEAKVASVRASMDQERAILEAMAEDLKAEPDDYALERRVNEKRAKLEKAQQELTAMRLDLREQTDIYARAERAHNDRIVQVDRAAQALHSGIRQREVETVTQTESTKRLNEEWNTGLKNFFESDLKGLDLTPGEQKSVKLALEAQVNEYITQHNALPDINQWIRSQKAAVSESVRNERLAIQKRLVNQKNELLPSKPADNIAKGKQSSGKTSSFKSSLREAEAALDRAWPA